MMKEGSYFHKHDFGRNKRSRKHMKLSPDGLTLKWRAVGKDEVVVADSPGGGSSARGVFRSASFSRTTSSACPAVHNACYCCHAGVVAAQGRAAACLQMLGVVNCAQLHDCSLPLPYELLHRCGSGGCATCALTLRNTPARLLLLTRRRCTLYPVRLCSRLSRRVAHHLWSVHGHIRQEDGARPPRSALGMLLARA